MDTVIGVPGGKCLLTIHFVESSLMLAFLRDANTSQSVINIFNAMDKILGAELFHQLFPVILTDNGSEFSNPLSLEFNGQGIGRTRIFFCNPRCFIPKRSY